MSKVWRDYSVDQALIEELREKVYAYTKQHPDEIDADDVHNRIASPEDVANNNSRPDWMLKRLLIAAHKNTDDALKAFVEFFKFRKQYEVSKLSAATVIPKEFYAVRALEIGGKDREGNQLLFIRMKYYKKSLDQLDDCLKRGIVYYFELMDKMYEEGELDGACIFLDSEEFGVSNVNLDMLQFLVRTIPSYYSGLVKKILIYEVPFMLGFVLKAVEGWVPGGESGKKFFSSITKKTLPQHIDKDQMPEYSNNNSVMDVPKDASPFRNIWQHFRIEQKNAEKINEYLLSIAKM